jgi:hypothetical protein
VPVDGTAEVEDTDEHEEEQRQDQGELDERLAAAVAVTIAK